MFIIENITDIFLPIWTLWVRCGYVLWANLSLAFLARFELWAKALWANLSLAFLARFELWAKALWANLSLVFLARFELWAKALWANLSLSRARSELRDWLTRPLLGSLRRDSVTTLYATLVVPVSRNQFRFYPVWFGSFENTQRKGLLVISLGLLLANSWKAFKEWGQVFILYFIYFKRGWGAGSGLVHVGGRDIWRGKWGKVSSEGFGTIVVVLGLVLQLLDVALARVFLFPKSYKF